MLITERDYSEIQGYLQEQRWNNGYEYVAYPDDGFPVDKYQLVCFSNDQEAQEYCFENTTDMDTYNFVGIRPAYRAMSEGTQGLIPMVERNGAIDLIAMVEAHYQRIANQQLSISKKGVVMTQEQNFDYLDNQVRYFGFKDFPSEELKNKMDQKRDDFEIRLGLDIDTHLGKGTGKANALLKFSKSQSTDTYFFNSYDMEAQRSGEKFPMTQTFYTNNRVTAKEAFNLMEGRSVHKTLMTKDKEEYDAWLKLDFKTTDDKGNYLVKKFGDKHKFNLEETLAKYPIKELDNPQYKASLIENLQKGERQPVTFIKDGQEVKRFIDVNAQFKSITVYGEDHRPRLSESQLPKQAETQDATTQEQQTPSQNGTNSSGSNADAAQENTMSTEAAPKNNETNSEGKDIARQHNKAVSAAKDDAAKKENNATVKRNNRKKLSA